VLEKLILRRVVRSGVPGETTQGALQRLPEVLDDAEPQLMILCSGGNDLLQRLEEPATVANLRAMIRLARDRGIGVLLLAPPRPVILSSAPEYYAGLGKEFSIPVETEVLPRVLMDRSLKSDLVHPNAKGYAQVAAALAKLLRDAKAV
jgi:lysophospholipase L1-like esterase